MNKREIEELQGRKTEDYFEEKREKTDRQSSGTDAGKTFIWISVQQVDI